MKIVPRLLLLVLVAASAGCTRWRMSTLPPPEEAPGSLGAARLTPRSGNMVVLRDVWITEDSVSGWYAGDPDRSGLLRGPGRRVAIHRSQVLLYESAVRDRWATVGAVVLGVLAGYGLVAAYFVSQSG
ncbi:MAG TPA: hypothetical protein VFY65_13390 [Longimicrobium sp.]|nr:hypothetical protein [Longimicrobium sp.]